MTAASRDATGGVFSKTLADRFERDVMPLTPALYAHALRLTRNHPDAEDLLQDTLLRAFTAFAAFRHGTNLRAWLYRIQTNSYITGWRRRQRRLEVSLGDGIEFDPLVHDPRSGARHPKSAEEEALLDVPDLDIASAVGDLPENFRIVVYYAEVVGLPVKHIAALTQSPVGTVASRLHRGRSRLRALLCARTDTALAASHTPPRGTGLHGTDRRVSDH